jgi:anti-sigma28 factor (negative regulator of flagellin synthesis)
MASNRVEITSSAVASVATPESNVAKTAVSTQAPAEAPAAPVVDRVTLDQVGQIKTLVATGVTMAASERSERLHHLAQAVRSGTYRPNASQLAEQILAEAELDARIATVL